MAKGTELEGAKVAAFFDVDETVIRGASSWLMARELFRNQFFGVSDLLFAAWHAFIYVVLGEDRERLKKITDRALRVMAGRKESEVERISAQVCDLLEEKVFPQAEGLIARHKAAGHDVWLVSAAPEEIPSMLAARLGLTGGVGTIIKRQDGVYLPELASGLLHAKGKQRELRRLAQENGYDLEKCFGYSDSMNDLPLLTTVGKPSAINPDVWLRVWARQHGWPVIDFRADRDPMGAWRKLRARLRGV